MRIVLTIVGKDQVGIIAKISNLLAEHEVNILNINQTILEGFFNM
ncbi:MAG: ACT domain-containing protein, partial [Acidaminococcaceae bacterium]